MSDQYEPIKRPTPPVVVLYGPRGQQIVRKRVYGFGQPNGSNDNGTQKQREVR